MSRPGQIALALFLAALAVATFFAALLFSVPARAHECMFPLDKVIAGFVANGGALHSLTDVAGENHDQRLIASIKDILLVAYVDRGCIVAPVATMLKPYPDA